MPKTVKPARAKISALARPIPEEAPVTIAVFPEFRFIVKAPNVRGLACDRRLNYDRNITLCS
ncbi:msr2119 [Mesorhizobium japonicum MAFF 303099]|uniref:Msr2119 protein n=1 Tax=Mesorhizobium japonicum (strain LMG 29417 / CECT 9101 / MAFF 303099) TaxID=266835 RepID=Q98J39_RHILO|nr:msr2119 [Mesorhizobium japonicum MAFF 303099]